MIRILILTAALALAACASKKAPTTPDPSGGATYGGASYGDGEPTGEPRPDPCGSDPDGY